MMMHYDKAIAERDLRVITSLPRDHAYFASRSHNLIPGKLVHDVNYLLARHGTGNDRIGIIIAVTSVEVIVIFSARENSTVYDHEP